MKDKKQFSGLQDFDLTFTCECGRKIIFKCPIVGLPVDLTCAKCGLKFALMLLRPGKGKK